MLDQSVASLAGCEHAYIAYHAAKDDQEKLQDAVHRALAEIDALDASLTADIRDLVPQLHALDNQITLLTEPVRSTHALLIAQYEKVKSKVKNAFDLSVPQIVNALTTFAFAPNKGMGAIQLGHLAYQGYSSVPNLGGEPVRKEHIIGKLDRTEASVKGIKSALSKDKLDGSFELDDPFGTRLLATQDEITTFMAEYAESSFADTIEEMKSKFDDYVKAIVARNSAVLKYNIVINLLVEKAAKKDENAAKRQKLTGRIIKKTDPDLPEIADYIEAMYNSSRAAVLKQLNFLVRSLNFRMLQELDIYSVAFGDGTDTDRVPLTMTSVVLETARTRVEQRFSQAMERWGSQPSKFPPEFDLSQGKVHQLEESEWRMLISDPWTVSEAYTITHVS